MAQLVDPVLIEFALEDVRVQLERVQADRTQASAVTAHTQSLLTLSRRIQEMSGAVRQASCLARRSAPAPVAAPRRKATA